MTTERRLYRSRDKVIAGVCAGFADRLDVDPTLIRLLYAGVSIFTAGFPGLLFYAICWIVIPREP